MSFRNAGLLLGGLVASLIAAIMPGDGSASPKSGGQAAAVQELGVAELVVEGPRLVGGEVSVGNCTLNNADAQRLFCSLSSGESFRINGDTLAAGQLRQAVGNCDGRELAARCQAVVKGRVTLGDAGEVTLDHASISWRQPALIVPPASGNDVVDIRDLLLDPSPLLGRTVTIRNCMMTSLSVSVSLCRAESGHWTQELIVYPDWGFQQEWRRNFYLCNADEAVSECRASVRGTLQKLDSRNLVLTNGAIAWDEKIAPASISAVPATDIFPAIEAVVDGATRAGRTVVVHHCDLSMNHAGDDISCRAVSGSRSYGQFSIRLKFPHGKDADRIRSACRRVFGEEDSTLQRRCIADIVGTVVATGGRSFQLTDATVSWLDGQEDPALTLGGRIIQTEFVKAGGNLAGKTITMTGCQAVFAGPAMAACRPVYSSAQVENTVLLRGAIREADLQRLSRFCINDKFAPLCMAEVSGTVEVVQTDDKTVAIIKDPVFRWQYPVFLKAFAAGAGSTPVLTPRQVVVQAMKYLDRRIRVEACHMQIDPKDDMVFCELAAAKHGGVNQVFFPGEQLSTDDRRWLLGYCAGGRTGDECLADVEGRVTVRGQITQLADVKVFGWRARSSLPPVDPDNMSPLEFYASAAVGWPKPVTINDCQMRLASGGSAVFCLLAYKKNALGALELKETALSKGDMARLAAECKVTDTPSDRCYASLRGLVADKKQEGVIRKATLKWTERRP